MATVIELSGPDLAWLPTIRQRRAILWLGSDARSALGPAIDEGIAAVLALPWAAVYCDSVGLPLEEHNDDRPSSGVVVRVLESVGDEQLPANRMPVFLLPEQNTGPRFTLQRLRMLERAPLDCEVFAVGVKSDSDVQHISEALEISPAFARLVMVADTTINLQVLARVAEQVFAWRCSSADLQQWLRTPGPLAEGRLAVVLRGPKGLLSVDLAEAVDPSDPITAAFDLISESAVLSEVRPNADLLQQLLEDPTASWEPYAAGVAFPREGPYVKDLTLLLDKIGKEGAVASTTAWLRAEDGSGATTLLRQVVFALARRGVPVLVARSGRRHFDFNQLSVFLARASDRIADAGLSVPELPWIVAFDAEHTLFHADLVTGLCNGLRKLLKPVVVLAVSPRGGARRDSVSALGNNRTIGKVLPNAVESEEALALGQHLASYLPPNHQRGTDEWLRFLGGSARVTSEGARSLFWVALRFWLFRLASAEQPLRQWIASKFEAIAGGRRAAYAGILEVAALTKNRLLTPAILLEPDSRQAVYGIAADSENSLGLRQFRGTEGTYFTLSHPLIAEELISIAMSMPMALESTQKTSCLGLFDLELHLLGRLIARPEAGEPASVKIIEELVTSSLRVDPRESPRNWAERERIVEILEQAPDALWDASQVFNHHVAIARRHLAVDPPDRNWTLEQQIEQLQFAENHLRDAIEIVVPESDDRAEDPLNLQVSFALTCDVRAGMEERAGNAEMNLSYRRLAEAAYARAEQMDSDNSYVLENFARFKLRQARVAIPGEERTRLLVDSIELLNRERSNDASGSRQEAILDSLADAYNLLRQGDGERFLEAEAARGSEVATVALCWLSLQNAGWPDVATSQLEAVALKLTGVDPRRRSWRSVQLLYSVRSRMEPHDFLGRVALLQELSRDSDYKWPLQTRLEYGILLFQVGDANLRRLARDVFQELRTQFPTRSGTIHVPLELRFLADPAAGFRKRLATTMRVKDVSGRGRNFTAIPSGWFNLTVTFRPFLFGSNVRAGQERDCFIEFSNFGPQAVPVTTE